MMVADRYDDASMKIKVWQKDLAVIGEHAAQLGCPTPLMSATLPIYAAAMSMGHAAHDTAAVCAVLEEMAGVKRKPGALACQRNPRWPYRPGRRPGRDSAPPWRVRAASVGPASRRQDRVRGRPCAAPSAGVSLQKLRARLQWCERGQRMRECRRILGRFGNPGADMRAHHKGGIPNQGHATSVHARHFEIVDRLQERTIAKVQHVAELRCQERPAARSSAMVAPGSAAAGWKCRGDARARPSEAARAWVHRLAGTRRCCSAGARAADHYPVRRPGSPTFARPPAG